MYTDDEYKSHAQTRLDVTTRVLIYMLLRVWKKGMPLKSNVSNVQVHVYTECSSNLQIRLLLKK